MSTSGSARPGPLTGIRVVDLSRVLAGPFATQQLADLGAEVIKVENPAGGDETRSWGPPFAPDGRSAYFLSCNRGKRSIGVDLGDERGRDLIRQLVSTADVVIENFRRGRLERWGLGLESLRREHPQLITCSISGFGHTGARRDEPGYDALIQAMSGLMSITGPAEGPYSKVGVAIVDVLCGLFAATGILASLRGREGAPPEARHVEVSLYDSALSALVNVASNVLTGGEDAGRYGNAHPSIVPYDVFPAADGEIFLAIGNDGQWRTLVEVLGDPELDREEWAHNPDRVRDRGALVESLSRVTRRTPRAVLLERLGEAGLPAGPLQTVAEALDDPAFRERGGVVEHSDGSRSVGSPLRGSDGMAPAPPAPRPGEHTREILEELGIEASIVTALLAAGVVSAGS